MATLRCIFVPFYAKWWLRETSSIVFVVILYVFSAQIVNLSIYHAKISVNKQLNENICYADVWIPFIMIWILSLIHSNIVATNSEPGPCSANFCRTKRYRKKRSVTKHMNMDEAETSFDTSNYPTSKINKKRLYYDTNPMLNLRSSEAAQDKIKINYRKNDYHKLTNIRQNTETSNGINHLSSDEDKRKKSVGMTSNMNNNYAQTNDAKNADEINFSWINSTSEPNSDCRTQREKSDLPYSSDSGSEVETRETVKQDSKVIRKEDTIPLINVTHITDSTCDTDEDGEIFSSPDIAADCYLTNRFIENEWTGVTTNSEDGSCSSDLETYSDTIELNHDQMAAAAILTPTSAKVSCTIWEGRDVKKAELSVLEISSSIISKVESMSYSKDYFYIGLVVSTLYAVVPFICLVCNHFMNTKGFALQFTSYHMLENGMQILLDISFGMNQWEQFVTMNILIQRWILTSAFFFLLCVAEKTFKQRFLYAKLFSQLTSSQRARNSELPHFRLNKVRNIKTWLSVRSYLKKRGPQRSVDVIVSAAFIITLLLISFLCLEMVKDTISLNSQHHIEASLLCLGLGIILLRFMTLGTKINKKYRNLSVLITEQINLHLQIEQKPHKKDELTVANNVLKLAIDLLKELDNPFKISGLSANPILYNITKVIILSALSGILSEMLGFKLKLHKIKIK